jgi:hypothetical protein
MAPMARRGHHRADAWEAWAFLGPSGGDDAAAGITAYPTTAPAAISLATNKPANPMSADASVGSVSASTPAVGSAIQRLNGF